MISRNHNIYFGKMSIEEIRTHDAAIGDALKFLADEFQYDEMLQLFQKAKKHET